MQAKAGPLGFAVSVVCLAAVIAWLQLVAPGVTLASVQWSVSALIQAQAALAGLVLVGATFLRTRADNASAELAREYYALKEALRAAAPLQRKKSEGQLLFEILKQLVVDDVTPLDSTTAVNACLFLLSAHFIYEERGAHDVWDLLALAFQDEEERRRKHGEFFSALRRLGKADILEKFYEAAVTLLGWPWVGQEITVLAPFVERYNEELAPHVDAVRRAQASGRMFGLLIGVQLVSLILSAIVLLWSSDAVLHVSPFRQGLDLTVVLFALSISLLAFYAEGILKLPRQG